MEVLHRPLIVLAVLSCILAIVAHFGATALWGIASPSGWLRFTNTLLFFAIALMLEQMLARAKKA